MFAKLTVSFRRANHGSQPVLQHGQPPDWLVGMWDVVAFDEVAGITFKDKDGVQIMKDYMASGSFSRGRDSIEGKASMVFVGNINQSVETLVKTSHLLAPSLPR